MGEHTEFHSGGTITHDAGVVRVDGALLQENRKELQAALLLELDAIDAHGRARIVCDLTPCRYIDTAGVGELLASAKSCRIAGVEFMLAGLNPDLKEMFAVTKLDHHFAIADTLERALA